MTHENGRITITKRAHHASLLWVLAHSPEKLEACEPHRLEAIAETLAKISSAGNPEQTVREVLAFNGCKEEASDDLIEILSEKVQQNFRITP